jgi:hypothetical protein
VKLSESASLATLPFRARLTQRSYWALLYRDERIVTELDCDWSLAPQHGRKAVRLCCPNGQVAELGGSDAEGRLFQFKGGMLTGGMRSTRYHLIGIIDALDGTCRCAVWDYEDKTLKTFIDNAYGLKFESVGALNLDVLGLRS